MNSDEHGRWTTKTIWASSREMKTKFSNVAILNGFIYGLSDTRLACVELATGKRRWIGGNYGHGQILRAGDLLFVESEEGEVALVAAAPDQYSEFARFPAVEGKTWNTLCLWGGRYLLVRNSQEAACYELPLAGSAK